MTAAVLRHARDRRDAAAVRELDDRCFPPAGPDGHRAAPDELEAAVRAGLVHVLELDGRRVGYLQLDRSPERIYIAGMAVLPELQGRGLGGAMLEAFVRSLGAERREKAVVTVTSPRNQRMVKALTRHGFAGRWVLRDHFGPGRHRVGFQLQPEFTGLPERYERTVAVTRLDATERLMAEHELVIRSLQGRGRRARFGLVRCHPDAPLAAYRPTDLPRDLVVTAPG